MQYIHDFLVIENLKTDFINGCDFIRQHQLIPDLYTKITENIIFFLHTIQQMQNLELEEDKLPFHNINPTLHPAKKEQIKILLETYKDRFT
ncbi:hypothetical protein PR048_009646 [Dryococelus australis]|uniref:Uncharacterized protein n=1 Tax=Dryococelus australis TaxID=614101 RepID=A0ABQ9I1F7_9NEOP|nr:hypothetical protein PR048_009646 [Dryococelus australis]